MKTTTRTVRTLSWLVSILLAFSLAPFALAEVGTTFPWLTYTMDVALVTADSELVNFNEAPDDGTMVLVKLVCLSGAVKTDDIRKHSGELTLRDGNGDEYIASARRMTGLDTSDSNDHKDFELLYFMKGKDASALEGAKLLVPDGDGRRILVPLDKAPHETVESAKAKAGTADGASFVMGGIPYTICTLDDEPDTPRTTN